MQVHWGGGKTGRTRRSISLSHKIANGPPTSRQARHCADTTDRVLSSRTNLNFKKCKAMPVAKRHFRRVANLWILFCCHQYKRVPVVSVQQCIANTVLVLLAKVKVHSNWKNMKGVFSSLKFHYILAAPILFSLRLRFAHPWRNYLQYFAHQSLQLPILHSHFDNWLFWLQP